MPKNIGPATDGYWASMKDDGGMGVKVHLCELPDVARIHIDGIKIRPGIVAVMFDAPEEAKERVKAQCGREPEISVAFPEMERSFPSVNTIIIAERVLAARMTNGQFPNVLKVVSLSPAFETTSGGNCLVMVDGQFGLRKSLLNVFHKEDGDVIDMEGINNVDKNAFSGAGDIKLINVDERIREYVEGILEEEKEKQGEKKKKGRKEKKKRFGWGRKQ